MGSLDFYNNSFFNSIYSSILIFKIACIFYLEVFFEKISIKRLILALVIPKVINISGLIYINLIGLGGFYKEVFRQKLTVII